MLLAYVFLKFPVATNIGETNVQQIGYVRQLDQIMNLATVHLTGILSLLARVYRLDGQLQKTI